MLAFLGLAIGDRRGISAVEFAMITPVFCLFIFGIIDFSRMLWEWNRAQEATQLGVRFAVVSPLVAGGLDFDGVPMAGGSGLPVPVSSVNSGDPIVCTSTGTGNASCTPNGYNPYNATAFTNIVNRMRNAHDGIQHSNVVIEYRHIGLGFAGNPYGPDIAPLVTIRLVNMQFIFVTPGLAGLATINMPGFAASLTAEDLG
jgi:hypothetical protein